MLFLRYYLWIAPHLLLVPVLVGLVRRRLHKQFPIFSSYLVFELAQFLALITISVFLPSSSITSYRWALAFGIGIAAFLRLTVIYELADELFVSRSSLAVDLRTRLRWLVAVLLLLAAGTCGALIKAKMDRATNIFQVLDFSSSVIQAGLLVTLFLFARVLRISWRSGVAGIALGFGILSTLDLGSAALRGTFGRSSYIAVDVVQMAAFHVCVLVWLVYFLLPESVPRFAGKGLKKPDLEFWDQELQRMVRR